MKKNDWSKRVQRVYVVKPTKIPRKCALCLADISLFHGRSIYCGNARKKTGCAFESYILRNKKWKHDVKYWERPTRRINARIYYKTYDAKRIRTHVTSPKPSLD